MDRMSGMGIDVRGPRPGSEAARGGGDAPVSHGARAEAALLHLARLAAAAEALTGSEREQAPLRGRYVALLAGSQGPRGFGKVRHAGLDAIDVAATSLGARTARPSISHACSDSDLAMLAGLYDLVCCDTYLDDLARRIRRRGVPVAHGLLMPYNSVAVVALLLALRRQAPSGVPIVLTGEDPQGPARSAFLPAIAAMLGMSVLQGDGIVPDPGPAGALEGTPVASGHTAPAVTAPAVPAPAIKAAGAPGAAPAWHLEAAPGGYAAWRLRPPDAVPHDIAGWDAELSRTRGLALQAALLQAVS